MARSGALYPFDHRPILLELVLPGNQHRPQGRPLSRPPCTKIGEVPSQKPLLLQFQAQLADRRLAPVVDADSTSTYLFQICVDSASIATLLNPPLRHGHRWKDGWFGPPMICPSGISGATSVVRRVTDTGGLKLTRTPSTRPSTFIPMAGTLGPY